MPDTPFNPLHAPPADLFNSGEFAYRCNYDAELAAELVELFHEAAVGYLAGMERCVAEANGEELRRFAHSMKGSAANLAVLKLRDASASLEQAAADGQLEKVEAMVAQVRRELDVAFPLLPSLVQYVRKCA